MFSPRNKCFFVVWSHVDTVYHLVQVCSRWFYILTTTVADTHVSTHFSPHFPTIIPYVHDNTRNRGFNYFWSPSWRDPSFLCLSTYSTHLTTFHRRDVCFFVFHLLQPSSFGHVWVPTCSCWEPAAPEMWVSPEGSRWIIPPHLVISTLLSFCIPSPKPESVIHLT
jgi:hypothetical protein